MYAQVSIASLRMLHGFYCPLLEKIWAAVAILFEALLADTVGILGARGNAEALVAMRMNALA